jgi:hypothetical protein
MPTFTITEANARRRSSSADRVQSATRRIGVVATGAVTPI